MSFLPPVVIEIGANATQAIASMRTVNGELSAMQAHANATGASLTRLEKAAVVSSAAFKAVGLAVVAVSVMSVKAAMEQEAAFSRMDEAIKNAKYTTSATGAEFRKATDAAIEMGFADETAAGALGTLVTATGSAKESQKLLNTSMDLARYKHIDLNTAATIVARGTQGSAKAFKELGITLDTTIPKQQAINKAFDQLQGKIGGQAKAYLETFAGRMSVLAAKTDQLAETWGDILIPIISKVVDFLTRFGKQLAIMGAVIVSGIVAFKIFTTVLNVFKAAQILYIALTVGQTAAQTALTFATAGGAKVTKSMAAAQAILNAVMAVNPYVAIAIAVIAVVTALVILYQKNEKVRNAMIATAQGAIHAFGLLLGAIGWVFEAFLKLETGPLKLLLKGLAALGFGPAKNALKELEKGIKTVGGFFDEAKKKVDNYADSLDKLKKHTVADAAPPGVKGLNGVNKETPFDLSSYTGVESGSGSGSKTAAIPGSAEWMKEQAGTVTYIYNINTTAQTNASAKMIADNTVTAIKFGKPKVMTVPKATVSTP